MGRLLIWVETEWKKEKRVVERRVKKQERAIRYKNQSWNNRGQDLQTAGAWMPTGSREADLWTQTHWDAGGNPTRLFPNFMS